MSLSRKNRQIRGEEFTSHVCNPSYLCANIKGYAAVQRSTWGRGVSWTFIVGADNFGVTREQWPFRGDVALGVINIVEKKKEQFQWIMRGMSFKGGFDYH